MRLRRTIVPMDLRTTAPTPSSVSTARTLLTTDLVRLDMGDGGDRGISRRAERIEMKRRKIVDPYLYQTGILELIDDTDQSSNIPLLIINSSRNLSNPLFENGRIFSRSATR